MTTEILSLVTDFYEFVKAEAEEFQLIDKTADRKDYTDKLKRVLRGQSSINKEAKKSIAYYPILASDSCNFEIARSLVNAVEADAAVMTKLVIERIGMIRLDQGQSKSDLVDRVRGFQDIAEEVSAIPELKILDERFELGEADDDGLNRKSVDGKTLLEGNGPYRTPAQQGMDDVDKEITKQRLLGLERATQGGRIGDTTAVVEIKKQNKKEPTRVEVEIEYNTGNDVRTAKFAVGVKSLLHTIPSEEIIKFLPKAKSDTSFLIRLAKLYTGEIKFWKDFVLTLGDIKDSFDKQKAGTNKWFYKLKRLTSGNNMARFRGKKGLMPTATLAISMEDAEDLFRKTSGKFDVRTKYTAEQLIKSLSLLNLVIIDEGSERVWWYSDISEDFDMYTLDDLERLEKSSMNKDLLKALVKTAG